MTTDGLNASYIGKRDDILSLIPTNAKLYLDVGCSNGTLGEQIKLNNKNVTVHGIEIHDEMGNIAKTKLDRVFIGNAEDEIGNLRVNKNKYDCIIFADILEHLLNPWAVLTEAKSLLNYNGKIIASIPNINYYRHLAIFI